MPGLGSRLLVSVYIWQDETHKLSQSVLLSFGSASSRSTVTFRTSYN